MNSISRPRIASNCAFGFFLIAATFFFLFPGTAWANPTSVTVTGSFQDELGCSGDWQPDCATTHLTYAAAADVW